MGVSDRVICGTKDGGTKMDAGKQGKNAVQNSLVETTKGPFTNGEIGVNACKKVDLCPVLRNQVICGRWHEFTIAVGAFEAPSKKTRCLTTRQANFNHLGKPQLLIVRQVSAGKEGRVGHIGQMELVTENTGRVKAMSAVPDGHENFDNGLASVTCIFGRMHISAPLHWFGSTTDTVVRQISALQLRISHSIHDSWLIFAAAAFVLALPCPSLHETFVAKVIITDSLHLVFGTAEFVVDMRSFGLEFLVLGNAKGNIRTAFLHALKEFRKSIWPRKTRVKAAA